MKILIDTLQELQKNLNLSYQITQGFDGKAEVRVFGVLEQHIAFTIVEPEIKMGEQYYAEFGKNGATHYQVWDFDLTNPETREEVLTGIIENVSAATAKFNEENNISTDVITHGPTNEWGDYRIKFVASQDELYALGAYLDNSLAWPDGEDAYNEILDGYYKIGMIFNKNEGLIGSFNMYQPSPESKWEVGFVSGINSDLLPALPLYDNKKEYQENLKAFETQISEVMGLERSKNAEFSLGFWNLVEEIENHPDASITSHVSINPRGMETVKFFGRIDNTHVNFAVSATTSPDEWNVVLNGRNYPFNWKFNTEDDNAFGKLVDDVLKVTRAHHEEKEISVQGPGHNEAYLLKPDNDRYQVSFVTSQAEAYHLGCFFDNALQCSFGNTYWFQDSQEGNSKIGILYDMGHVVGNFYIRDNNLEFIRGHHNVDLLETLSFYDASKTRKENLEYVLAEINKAAGLDVSPGPSI